MVFIDPFCFYVYFQALQYSLPAGYMLTETFIFNRNVSHDNGKDNTSMHVDLI